ncbi:unnamed protein product [Symbiodinium pilosum]|uniref:Uncharacterized protein n=1 Tax=Symbiodinium pilosum TaxID=2952 RepID=A0A812VHZ2_SYMPI|nr:unnamed protein product [Symbiodinium pilosum]
MSQSTNVKTSVLGPDRFRNRQVLHGGSSGDARFTDKGPLNARVLAHRNAVAACATAPSKKPKIADSVEVGAAEEATLRRNCLVDWMEMSVHVTPGQRSRRAAPQGFQEQYTSVVRHYLTSVSLKRKGTVGRKQLQAGWDGDEKPLLVQVQQACESTEGMLLMVQVAEGSPARGIAEGSLMRILLHQRHPALQSLMPHAGSWIQVIKFNMLQAEGPRGALLLPVELATAPDMRNEA